MTPCRDSSEKGFFLFLVVAPLELQGNVSVNNRGSGPKCRKTKRSLNIVGHAIFHASPCDRKSNLSDLADYKSVRMHLNKS